jgi:hypothetical protein
MSTEKESATERVARELTEALVGEQRSLSATGEKLPPPTDEPTPGGLWQAAPAVNIEAEPAGNEPVDPGTPQANE